MAVGFRSVLVREGFTLIHDTSVINDYKDSDSDGDVVMEGPLDVQEEVK